jgi:hypothetical protein
MALTFKVSLPEEGRIYFRRHQHGARRSEPAVHFTDVDGTAPDVWRKMEENELH